MSQQYPQYTNQPQPGGGTNQPFNPQYLQNPQQLPPLQPPKQRRRWVPWVVAIGTFLLGLIIGSATNGSSTTSTAGAGAPQPTVTKTVPGPAGATVPGPTVTKTVPGPAKTVTAPPPGPKAAITEDGIYLVGVDI